jgi:YqaJ-like viral recombinase domain
LTSSIVGTFLHLRPTTDPVNTFLQKQKFFTSSSVAHGRSYEERAIAHLLQMRNDITQQIGVGLVVNPYFFFFGASPDRLVKIDEELVLVEVKCPYNPYIRKVSLKTVFKEKDFYVNYDDEKKPFLKPNHHYYAQIQGQMAATNLQKTLLVVFIPPADLEVIEVLRNESFIEEMVTKLHQIYVKNLGPYFVREKLQQ